MKRLSFFLPILLLVCIGCGPKKQQNKPHTMREVGEYALSVLMDSTSTWKEVIEAVNPLVDSLSMAAIDENDLRRRLSAQELGYIVIESIVDKYINLQEGGEKVSEDDLNRVVGSTRSAICSWFYDDTSDLPHIWRDHYYVSNKSADKPVNGYFHIMVSVPTDENPQPSLLVFYPESAEDMPAIIFREHEEDQAFDDEYDMRDIIVLEAWSRKDELEDGYPMYASAGPEVVEKMMSNAVMYLLFRSAETESGDPGELEVASVSLEPFHTIWKEIKNK